jgi:hypothetical protein
MGKERVRKLKSEEKLKKHVIFYVKGDKIKCKPQDQLNKNNK